MLQEFKKFITKGNVMDLAVGVIMGSAFTSIVTTLTESILKPFINFCLAGILKGDSLSSAYTFLKKVEVDGVVNLQESIYIDWGSLINAIINFLITAFVLFLIVKFLNKLNEIADNENKRLIKKFGKNNNSKEEVKEEVKESEEIKLLKEINNNLKKLNK